MKFLHERYALGLLVALAGALACSAQQGSQSPPRAARPVAPVTPRPMPTQAVEPQPIPSAPPARLGQPQPQPQQPAPRLGQPAAPERPPIQDLRNDPKALPLARSLCAEVRNQLLLARYTYRPAWTSGETTTYSSRSKDPKDTSLFFAELTMTRAPPKGNGRDPLVLNWARANHWQVRAWSIDRAKPFVEGQVETTHNNMLFVAVRAMRGGVVVAELPVAPDKCRAMEMQFGVTQAVQSLGNKSMTVPAGTFATEHLRIRGLDGTSEVWVRKGPDRVAVQWSTTPKAGGPGEVWQLVKHVPGFGL